jgi:Costars
MPCCRSSESQLHQWCFRCRDERLNAPAISPTLECVQCRFGGRVKFGVLCRDDRCSNICEEIHDAGLPMHLSLPSLDMVVLLLDMMQSAHAVEALGGTLKAAKKRKLIGYDSELLLQGVRWSTRCSFHVQCMHVACCALHARHVACMGS